MDVAIGLPNAVPGTTGAQMVEWARRADALGFSSLGTIDRIVYDNYEPLTALAAAAAVTSGSAIASMALSRTRGSKRENFRSCLRNVSLRDSPASRLALITGPGATYPTLIVTGLIGISHIHSR